MKHQQLNHATRDKLIEMLRVPEPQRQTYFSMTKELGVSLGTVADWLARLRQNHCTCKQPIHKGPCNAPLPLDSTVSTTAAASTAGVSSVAGAAPPKILAQLIPTTSEAASKEVEGSEPVDELKEDSGSSSGRGIDDSRLLVETLHTERTKRGISLSAVARMAPSGELSKVVLSRYESGKTDPSLRRFCTIARILGFRVALVPITGTNTPTSTNISTSMPLCEEKSRPEQSSEPLQVKEEDANEREKGEESSGRRESSFNRFRFGGRGSRRPSDRQRVTSSSKVRDAELAAIEEFERRRGVTMCPSQEEELSEYDEKNPLRYNKRSGKFARRPIAAETGIKEG